MSYLFHNNRFIYFKIQQQFQHLGSYAKAFLKETIEDLLEETPLGFMCFIITVVGIFFTDERISNPEKYHCSYYNQIFSTYFLDQFHYH